MDEPHLSTNETSEGEKRDIDEVFDSTFTSDQKPMEVDEDDAFPSTSGGGCGGDGVESIPSELFESNTSHTSDLKAPDEEAGQDTSVADETIEQINFEKNQDSIDETHYTEKSINISQIDMEHQQDDSNDAFNALKRDETDALHHEETIKEETKEKSEEATPMETEETSSFSKEPLPSENIKDSTENNQDTHQEQPRNDEIHESTVNQTQTEDESVDMEGANPQKSPECESTEVAEGRSEDMDESVQSPVESTEKPPEEEEETETTNEGKII